MNEYLFKLVLIFGFSKVRKKYCLPLIITMVLRELFYSLLKKILISLFILYFENKFYQNANNNFKNRKYNLKRLILQIQKYLFSLDLLEIFSLLNLKKK